MRLIALVSRILIQGRPILMTTIGTPVKKKSHTFVTNRGRKKRPSRDIQFRTQYGSCRVEWHISPWLGVIGRHVTIKVSECLSTWMTNTKKDRLAHKKKQFHIGETNCNEAHLIYLFLCKSFIMRQLIQFAQVPLLLLVSSSSFFSTWHFLCVPTFANRCIFLVVDDDDVNYFLFFCFFRLLWLFSCSHLLFILEIVLFLCYWWINAIPGSLIGVSWHKRIIKDAKEILFSI